MLKVAVVSTCLYTVPPIGRHYYGYDLGWSGGYGGESQIYTLVKALCKAGVEVELFGTPGSEPPPKGHLHINPQGTWWDVFRREPQAWNMYKDIIMDCDIVHDWSLTKYAHHICYKEFNKKCVMQPWGTGAPPPFHNYNTICWSQYQRGLFLTQGYPKTTKYVYGSVDLNVYEPNYDEGKYFLYLSRIHPSKHPEIAIKLAKELGIKLYIACDTESPDHSYYLEQAQKECVKYPNIVFIIDPSFEAKRVLFSNAKGLIFASESECFGLVAIEALAHGTPLILRRHGAFPEIITHGEQGFLCDDFNDFVASVKQIDMIDRRACRKLVEDRFNSDIMAARYIEISEKVIGGETF